jgi:hypothetical protein
MSWLPAIRTAAALTRSVCAAPARGHVLPPAVTAAAAISQWPARNTAALTPGTLCFWIDAASRLARLSVVERPDTAGNGCPPAAAGSSKRPTAVTAPTAPKVRKEAYKLKPPVTSSRWPVSHFASLPQRNATTPPMS